VNREEPVGTVRALPLLGDLGDVADRHVLVRVDFNTPLEMGPDGHPAVADEFRIRAALPTLNWLKDHGARVTACSHLGRPDGVPDERWDMAPVRHVLDDLCPGIELTDNLRFHPGEKKNDPAFVQELIKGCDAYVDEAFGVAHRAHASIVGPPAFLPSAAGLRLAEEVEVLGCLLERPERPFVAVVGGAKVADKIGLLRSLSTLVDTIAVGGAMAFTFLAAQGHDVGASLVDPSLVGECRELLEGAGTILLPTDIVALSPGGHFGPAAEERGPRGETRIVGVDVPDGWNGLDIGPESAAAFAEAVTSAGTVLWNGPLGAFEDERFAGGTSRVAEAVARCQGFTVVGGGDSASALEHLGMVKEVNFLSTGGGAALKFLEHGDLPGLQALREACNAPRTRGRTR
jgi:phosphoglycerate kinase